MGLLDKLKGLFSGSPGDPLAQAASSPDREEEFLRLLSERTIHFLSLNEGGEYEGEVTPEAVAGFIEENAREAEARETFRIYEYAEEGVRIIPLFSSEEMAGEWIRNGSFDRIVAFTLAGVSGTVLCGHLLDASFEGARVVLNPRSRFERTVSRADLHEASGSAPF